MDTVGSQGSPSADAAPRLAKRGLRPGGSIRNGRVDVDEAAAKNEKNVQLNNVEVNEAASGVIAEVATKPSIRFPSPGKGKQTGEQDPLKEEYGANGGRFGKKKNNKRGQRQRQHKPVEALKINSRASSWASKDVDGRRHYHQHETGSGRRAGGSQMRAKEVWAFARADVTKRDEELENENMATENTSSPATVAKDLRSADPRNVGEMPSTGVPAKGRKWSTAPTQARSFSSYLFGRDRGHASGKNNAIRKEWEKIDTNRARSPTEVDMEDMLILLNDAEIGTLSSRNEQLPIELPDGEGGTITATQEQNLADAAIKMIDTFSYHNGWTKEEARLAGQLLLRMEKEEILRNDRTQDKLTKTHYLSVINAYAKITAEDETASIRAVNLLDHMERRAEEGRADLKADRVMINTVLGAQAKHALSGDLNLSSIAAAERMLDTLEREFILGDTTMQPTARTYSKFIDLYAKNGRADDASRALERMELQYRNGNRAALPRTIHYTSVIDAIAKESGSSSNAARRAEDILRSMLDLYDKGDYHLAPDSVIFSATMDAYSKSNAPDSAERSLIILDLMDEYDVAPDIITFNVVLNTLMQNQHYCDKAKEILHFVEQSPTLRADSYSYNAVIKGCPPEDAEELIQHWEMEYKMGRTDERPDSYTYTSLIKSWTFSNRKGYEEKTINILRWMEEREVVGMNRIVYNEVMRSFSRSTRDDAGELAEGVFNQLVSRYRKTRDREWRPDKYSYMALVNAYARNCRSHDGAAKVESFLFQLVESNYRLDSKLLNNGISAWARSGSDDAVSRAEGICEQMDSLGVEIDGVCFNSLVNVYAKSRGPEKGIQALRVLERMNERNVAPTSVTYTLLFEACAGDQDLLIQVFESCINHGMLDDKLEHSFREHGPACIQEELSGKIPYNWREHANRGPSGPSRNQIKRGMKKGSTGVDVRRFGWAR